MKLIPTTVALALLSSMGAAGCADGSGGSEASRGTDSPADAGFPGDAGQSDDAASGADGEGLVVITGTVSFQSTSGGTPSGAAVEIVDASPANSTTVGGEGEYSLAVQPGTYFVRASRSDAISAQVAVAASQSTSAADLGLLSASLARSLASYLGFALESSKGIVVVRFATSDNGGGYGATLSADHGPSFAFPSRGFPRITPTSLPGDNNALYFANVAAGTTAVSFASPPGHSCEARVPLEAYRVDANAITEIDANCQ